MADGRIEIDIILDDGSVKKGIANLQGLENSSNKAGASIGSMVKAMGLVKIASTAFNVLKDSVGGAVSRFDTMQKFPKVMNALGFSAEDSKKSIDKLSGGIDGLPTKLDDVVASTQQMTAISGDLDKSTDTVLALNNAFLASGASADDANRGMQQYNQMLSTGTVDLESWKTLQETMPLALQKTAEAMGFTGKSAQRDLYQALKDGNVTFDQFQDKLIELGTGTGVLANLAKENSLGIATSFGNLRNAVSKNMGNILTKFDEIVQKLSGKSIAGNIDSLKGLINSAGSAIIKSMDNIIPTIEKATQFVKDHATAFKILGGVIVSVASGFLALKTSLAVISSLNKAISGVKKSFGLLKAAVAANPFTLVIAGIAALAVGITYLYKTNSQFKNFVNDIASGVGNLIARFRQSKQVTDLFATAMGALSSVGQRISNAFSTIKSAVTNSNSSINASSVVTKALSMIFASLLGPIGLAVKAFQLFAKVIGGGNISKGIDTILTSIQGIADGIATYGPQLGTSFGTALQGILSAIANALPGIVSGGLQIVSGLVVGIAQGLPTLAVAAAQLIMAFTQAMLILIPTVVLSATQIILAFLGAFTVALPQIIAAGAGLINALLQGITQQLPNLIANVANLIVTFLTALNAHLPEIMQAGFNLLINFLQGIAMNIGQVTQKAIDIVLTRIAS